LFISVRRPAAAGDSRLEIHCCQPEVALGLDRGDGRRDALALLRSSEKTSISIAL